MEKNCFCQLVIMIISYVWEHLTVSKELFNYCLIWSLEQPCEVGRTTTIIAAVVSPVLPQPKYKAVEIRSLMMWFS